MTKKDTFIVRPAKQGDKTSVNSVTLPGGRRVHTLDRAVFDHAVKEANTYATERSTERKSTKGALSRAAFPIDESA